MAPPENWFQGFRHHFLTARDPGVPNIQEVENATAEATNHVVEQTNDDFVGEDWHRLENDWCDLDDEWNEIDIDLPQYYEGLQQGRECLDQEGSPPNQADDHYQPECWHQGFRYHFTYLTDFQHHPARPAQNLKPEFEDYDELVRPTTEFASQVVDRDLIPAASIIESNNYQKQASLLQWLLWPFRALLETLFAMSR
jgi:hypothetical protein